MLRSGEYVYHDGKARVGVSADSCRLMDLKRGTTYRSEPVRSVDLLIGQLKVRVRRDDLQQDWTSRAQ